MSAKQACRESNFRNSIFIHSCPYVHDIRNAPFTLRKNNASSHRIADKGLTEMLENTNLSLHHPPAVPLSSSSSSAQYRPYYPSFLQSFSFHSSLHTHFFVCFVAIFLDNYSFHLFPPFSSAEAEL